ncbi:acyl-CoA thioesterase [Alterinioella nitratireducens]|uniref:acyl-CoA thioesterase n=1 Tax=Alterinioella nitratireducens TaxID=2735915 RepID=UPI0040581194
MLTSRRTVLIEWGDCDPADIVFYPNYFRWFDASTAAHFRSAGLPKPKLVTDYNVVGFPMVDTRARFLVPSRFGDEVVIETRIAAFGRSSFEVEHRLMRGDVLAVEGFEKRVLVAKSADGAGLKSVPVPEDVRALFTGDDT